MDLAGDSGPGYSREQSSARQRAGGLCRATSSGPVGDISVDHPFSMVVLACAPFPLLGVWLTVCREVMGGWRHLPAGDLPAVRSGGLWAEGGKALLLPPSPLVVLSLPLKIILRIITFIMSFIMGDSSSCLKINAGLVDYIWYLEVVYM